MRMGLLVILQAWKKFPFYFAFGLLSVFFPLISSAQVPDLTGLNVSSTSGNNTKDDDLTSAYTLTGSAATAATAWYKNGLPMLTLYLPFEGGASNALLDLSGNNYPVTAVGTPAWGAAAGRDGFGAFSFDGTSYLNAGKVFPTKSSYTQTAWVYTTSSATYNYIFGSSNANTGHGLRFTYDWRLSAGQNGNLKIVSGWSGTVAANRWYFAAVTFDYATGTMILYQDGQPIDTAIVPLTSRDILDSIVQIGAMAGTVNWKGSLDDARIYNYALSEDQIKALYALHGADMIVAAETHVNDTWQARVTPFSSSAVGTTYSSNTITIIPTVPAFTSTPNTAAIAGKLYKYTAHATGGPTPTYQLTSFPSGMTIDSLSGAVRWYPPSAGTYNVIITAINTTGTATQSYSIDVAAPTVALTNVSLASIAGDSLACTYNYALQATTAATAWYKNGLPQMTLYMPFDGGSTFALDDASGNNITALPMGNPVWSSNAGHDGHGAFTYDGSSYLIAGNIFPTKSSYTNTAWIYRTTTGEYNHILSGWDHNNAATGGHGLRVTADQRLSAGHNGDWRIVQTNSGAILSNQWYFAAVTFNYSTGEMDLYLNGTLVNSAIAAANERDVTDPSILIGSTQGSFCWKGKIDDARVYNYPLTAQQIAALYTANGANRIVPQETQTGDVWQARVTPYSATEAGTPYASNSIIIGNADQPPVWAAIGPQSVNEGQNLNFNVSASDPDATIPALTTSALPPHAAFVDHGDGTGTFNFNPDYTQAGLYNISFFASDGTLIDTEIVPVTVVFVNLPPSLAAIGAQSVITGNTLNFNVTAADSNKETISLAAFNLPANASFIDHSNDTGSFSFTPVAGQGGIYNITFTATDPHAAVDSQVVPITVIDNSIPANWSAVFTVTGEVAGNALNTGQATIGIAYSDSSTFAPPNPPEFTAALQLWGPGSTGPYSKYLQKTGNKCYYWTLEIDPHGNVAPPTTPRCATLSWNPAQFSPSRHYVLHDGQDPAGPVIIADMRTTTSYQVCDIQTLHYYTVHWEDDSCANEVYVSMALNAGWNLISIPIFPKDSSLLTLFPAAQIAYGYNGQYFEANKLLPGLAYWLKVPAAVTVLMTGLPLNTYTSSLSTGWSLVGADNCTAAPQTTPSGLITEIFGFNGAYQPVTQLSSGMGYWVNASASGTLSVTCGAPKEMIASNSGHIVAITAQSSNTDGINQSDIVLGTGAAEQTLASPPDAPQYSVKLELYRNGWAGPYFEDIQPDSSGADTWIMALNSHGNIPPHSNGDIALSWNTQNMGNDLYELRAGFDGTGAVLVSDMRQVKELSVEGSDAVQYFTITRKSGSAALPDNFRLEQNHPNPFNPSTVIEYSIPQKADVHLAVFNLLGRKVKDIVNESQPAGSYRVTWDGTDAAGATVSTGVYLYRLEAGAFAMSKKMLLMK